jgi:hypothetical protein
MALQSDCKVTGTPTEIETKTFTVRMTSPDASGAVSRPGSIRVIGPNLAYDVPKSLIPNDQVRLSLIQPWPSGFAKRYEFDGVAPAGLAINPTTGVILGGIGPAGSNFTVALNVQTTAKSYRIVSPVVSALPELPTGLGFVSSISTWVGIPFSVRPVLPSGAVITSASIDWPFSIISLGTNALPGVVVDSATGALGGTANSGTDGVATPVNVDVSWLVAGVASSQRFQTSVVVKWPVDIKWTSACFVNVACNSLPQIIENAPYSFDGAIYSYELAPGVSLASGLVLNSTTGAVTGIPTVATFNSPQIKVTIIQGGRTFVITRPLAPIAPKPLL